MKTITVKDLAQLAWDGLIPSIFVRSWSKRTQVNPVKTASDIVHNARVNNLRILAACGIGLCGFVMLIEFWNARLSINQIVVSTSLALGLTVYGFWVHRLTEVSDADKTLADAFCADFSSFCEWSGCVETYLAKCDDDEELKKFARTALVEMAITKINLQEQKSDDPDGKFKQQIQSGHILAEFGHRYDTLQRLGLASGGWEKYFEDAENERIKRLKNRATD